MDLYIQGINDNRKIASSRLKNTETMETCSTDP